MRLRLEADHYQIASCQQNLASRCPFRAFQKELERRVSCPLKITSEGTPQVTGWFEVQVVNGPLLHSKKRGDGFVDSESKWKKIVDAINSLM
ncbi:Selenoprotein W [Fasciola gigantica]|uniref:Selenoprotein W n=1 Tax=Fasciola gigantica TaxID=46835 RepID=A0A504YNN5_FASGI|nr:Selenoprotein W [Fasciola gigantica]